MIRFNDPRLTKIRASLQATKWAQRLTKRTASTTAPIASTPLPMPTTEAASPVLQEINTVTEIEKPTARIFPQIRLGAAGPVQSAVIENHLLACENRELQGMAARCANAMSQLVTQGARVSFLSRAIEATHGTDSTPESWLASTLKSIESEIDATKQEHARHEARRKVRSARILPLRVAVSARLTAAETELPRLQKVIRSAVAHPFGDQAVNQYEKLVDAGLRPEQIALVGTENPALQIAAAAEQAKARLEVLKAERPALWAFSNDPRSNPDHLNGLAGFEALIAAAQNVSEEK